MWPDIYDVRAVAQHCPVVDAPAPEAVWQDAALVERFLRFARSACYNHGKHEYVLATEIKTLAESWIGHEIDPYAFVLGAKLADARFWGKSRAISKTAFKASFDSLSMKFPPCERLEEYRQAWQEEQRSVERDIEEEQRRKPF